jgi:hypothetical protein
MTQTVIEAGDKLHIITRRNFVDDLRRHFAGSVVAVSGGLIRLQGYASYSKTRRQATAESRSFGRESLESAMRG